MCVDPYRRHSQDEGVYSRKKTEIYTAYKTNWYDYGWSNGWQFTRWNEKTLQVEWWTEEGIMYGIMDQICME